MTVAKLVIASQFQVPVRLLLQIILQAIFHTMSEIEKTNQKQQCRRLLRQLRMQRQ